MFGALGIPATVRVNYHYGLATILVRIRNRTILIPHQPCKISVGKILYAEPSQLSKLLNLVENLSELNYVCVDKQYNLLVFDYYETFLAKINPFSNEITVSWDTRSQTIKGSTLARKCFREITNVSVLSIKNAKFVKINEILYPFLDDSITIKNGKPVYPPNSPLQTLVQFWEQIIKRNLPIPKNQLKIIQLAQNGATLDKLKKHYEKTIKISQRLQELTARVSHLYQELRANWLLRINDYKIALIPIYERTRLIVSKDDKIAVIVPKKEWHRTTKEAFIHSTLLPKRVILLALKNDDVFSKIEKYLSNDKYSIETILFDDQALSEIKKLFNITKDNPVLWYYHPYENDVIFALKTDPKEWDKLTQKLQNALISTIPPQKIASTLIPLVL